MNAPRRISLLLATLMTLLVCLPAGAQPRGPGAKRAKIEARMKEVRGKVLRKDVGLDDQRAKRVERILDKYTPQRRKLKKQERMHTKTLRALIQADSDDQPAYKRSIDGFRSTKNQLHALQNREYAELAKQLTPKQQAKLYVAIRKVRARLRKHLQRRMRARDR